MPIQEETHEVVPHTMTGVVPNMLSASSTLTRSQRSLYRSSEMLSSASDQKRSGPGGSESDQTRVSLMIGDNLELEERTRGRDSEDDGVLSDFSDLFDGVLDDIDKSNEKQYSVCLVRVVFALSITHKMSVESTNESHFTPQYTALVELLEKVYAEEIKIKGRIKLLREQIACDRVICSIGDGTRNEERSLIGNPRRQQVLFVVCLHS